MRAVALTMLALFAASHAPAQESQTAVEQAVRAYMRELLKDPESAQWELERPLFTPPSNEGSAVCYRINGKNSYGGYTGFKSHIFFVEGGKIVRHFTPDENAGTAEIERRMIRDMCSG